jgi:hypothetical protein
LICYGTCYPIRSFPQPDVDGVVDSDSDDTVDDTHADTDTDDSDAKDREVDNFCLPAPVREWKRFKRNVYCKPYSYSPKRYTALHTAIESQNVTAVKALLMAGANVEKRCAGLLPLERALAVVHSYTAVGFLWESIALEMAGMLLDGGANVSVHTAACPGASHRCLQPRIAAAVSWPGSRRCGWIVACVKLGLQAEAEAEAEAQVSSVKRACIGN